MPEPYYTDEQVTLFDTKFTERQMLDLLHLRYSQTNPGNGPRYACAEHVKNQAGFDARRCADFIAVDCWPTGGIELHGHEVKVSRSDWLHELKQPDKAEAFKRYMDRWWLVVPDAKIVKPGELPEGWGLLVVARRTTQGAWPNYHQRRTELRLRAATPAPRLEPEQMPKELLATLMRSTAKTSKRRAHDLFCSAPCSHQSRLLA
ncbi:hypothetical protein LAUMK4_05859 [Mycobacterium persicum]|uniref:Protein NO VEIN C-terminal domain-containing protein n=1 Tax=Mycobacterium persicum TaxID=1487726 RepID=A0ABY6RSJ1_9MYCO|nr:hypothetical protein [Mycobacterium persicum]ORB93975.1 hypothetical protein B1T44_04895 [Mycobacterium persicum]VAZ77492.1 hypothetical protein LAUMK15_03864 [Mycobacterium persicum]VBA33058.1 hypothetical protein LAUMK4_05859 [Mycobacterium persicum]